jgi:pimeloyl-ACP methyl ester carboxylesterase
MTVLAPNLLCVLSHAMTNETVTGATLPYGRQGEGEPLLLLHGLGASRRMWDPVIDILAEQRDVIACDLPGFGDARRLPRQLPPTVEHLADAIERFAGSLGLDRPHVVGNSLGGAVALELARRDVVASTTCLSPAGFFDDRAAARVRLMLGVFPTLTRALRPVLPALLTTAPGRAAILGLVVAHPGKVPKSAAMQLLEGTVTAPGYRETLNAALPYRVEPFHAHRRLTIAWAAKDKILTLEQAQRARAILPDAEHLLLTDCGHVPVWDDPTYVAATILHASRPLTTVTGDRS